MISGITSLIKAKSLTYLSQLANNSDSIAPMLTKDTLSNIAILRTYQKEGTKEDVAERAIEDFSTGAVWLLAIPAIKKIIDKTIYPIFKLNSKIDCRNLTNEFIEKAKNAANISQEEKDFFKSLTKSSVLKHKNAFLAKFAVSTIISALALIGIIKLKQKTTKDKLEKEINLNFASKTLVDNSIQNNKLHNNFKNKAKGSNISFGANPANLFLYNPIANTAILDGVITTTRLKEARKGERKEVALKEGFQIAFIYGLAKPIQKFFEAVGNKLNCPIDADPIVIFDKNLKENLSASKDKIKQILQTVKNEDLKDAIYNLDIVKDKALLELLEQNGAINLIKENGSIKAISYLNFINNKDIKKSLEAFLNLEKNIGKIKAIKGYKTVSVILNVLIAIGMIGKLQPKLVLFIRKLLNNGDNRNPAIVAQEKEMLNKKLKLQ